MCIRDSAHRHQRVVVPFLSGWDHADVHMDVGRNQLMEHILELAEILLNVPLDGCLLYTSRCV